MNKEFNDAARSRAFDSAAAAGGVTRADMNAAGVGADSGIDPIAAAGLAAQHKHIQQMNARHAPLVLNHPITWKDRRVPLLTFAFIALLGGLIYWQPWRPANTYDSPTPAVLSMAKEPPQKLVEQHLADVCFHAGCRELTSEQRDVVQALWISFLDAPSRFKRLSSEQKSMLRTAFTLYLTEQERAGSHEAARMNDQSDLLARLD